VTCRSHGGDEIQYKILVAKPKRKRPRVRRRRDDNDKAGLE
jgi:hypothetical protein